MFSLRRIVRSSIGFAFLVPAFARAQSTPGYAERVLQWTVQPGETCEQLAAALYGSEKFAYLLTRYNEIDCSHGGKLTVGQTLVVPERVTILNSATLESLSPEVRARVGGGNWFPAAPGMPLHRNDSVNTLARARADILFADRTHVVLAEHTLVVVYDTASQSTLVQKRPTAILLEEGELQSALSALRPNGETSIAVKGGGRVDAKSKDSVLRKHDKRTTVSVFDGTARVNSGGTTVQVPALHGSSFIVAQPPTPPRPLPPAPAWQAECTRGTLLATRQGGVIVAHWASVPNAKTYRVEFAHDAQFARPIVSEEVPATITSFRAEKLPPGSYYVRVRTIDADDFLGIAAESLAVEIVEVNLSGNHDLTGQSSIVVSPYGRLEFAPSKTVRMALDNGAFGPIPPRLDLLSLRPKTIKLRQLSDARETEYRIDYRPVYVEAQWVDSAQGRNIVASFSGLDSSELWTQLKPALRVVTPESTQLIAMTQATAAGVANALLPQQVHEPLVVEVVDRRGTVLARVSPPQRPSESKPQPKPPAYATGLCAPLSSMEMNSAATWWAPTSCNTASLAAKIEDSGDRSAAAQALARVSGMFGPIGLDALIQTNASHAAHIDNLAWFGVRWRALAGLPWSFGPALRLGLPPTSGAPREQLEAGLALSWQNPRWSWISDIGLRNQLRAAAPDQQYSSIDGFLITGVIYAVRDGFLSYANLDAHLSQRQVDDAWLGRVGATIGLETTGPLFLGFGTRFSPFGSSVGSLTSQLTLGIRN